MDERLKDRGKRAHALLRTAYFGKGSIEVKSTRKTWGLKGGRKTYDESNATGKRRECRKRR